MFDAIHRLTPYIDEANYTSLYKSNTVHSNTVKIGYKKMVIMWDRCPSSFSKKAWKLRCFRYTNCIKQRKTLQFCTHQYENELHLKKYFCFFFCLKNRHHGSVSRCSILPSENVYMYRLYNGTIQFPGVPEIKKHGGYKMVVKEI